MVMQGAPIRWVDEGALTIGGGLWSPAITVDHQDYVYVYLGAILARLYPARKKTPARATARISLCAVRCPSRIRSSPDSR